MSSYLKYQIFRGAAYTCVVLTVLVLFLVIITFVSSLSDFNTLGDANSELAALSGEGIWDLLEYDFTEYLDNYRVVIVDVVFMLVYSLMAISLAAASTAFGVLARVEQFNMHIDNESERFVTVNSKPILGVVCAMCNAELEPDQKFCRFCGTPQAG